MVDNLETPLSNSTTQASYTINQDNIKERAVKQEERNAAAAKPAETKPDSVPADPAKPVDTKTVDVPKQPNDPAEFHKKITQMGQDNASLKKELAEIKSLYEQLTQKPIDPKEIAELAKDPSKLQSKIDELVEERVEQRVKPIEQEHIRETGERVRVERERRRTDSKYPRWAELENLMGEITLGLPKDRTTDADGVVRGPGDPRINFNKPHNEVMDDIYELAKQLADDDAKAKGLTTPTKPVEEAPKALTAEEKEKLREEERERIRKELRAEAVKEQAGGTVVGASKGSGKSRVESNELVDKVSDPKTSINEARALLKKNLRRK